MQRFKHILFILTCILLTQCFESSFQKTDNKLKVLQALSSEVVLVRYKAFLSTSEDLSQAINRLCRETSEDSLVHAQEAWWSARQNWKQAEIVKFGPVKDYPLRLGPKLDTWPVNEIAVEELIEDNEITSFEQFSVQGGATRGLPVVEYLLWYSSSSDSVLSQLTSDSRRCDVLSWAGEDVLANANALVRAWQEEGWLKLTESSDLYEAPFEDSNQVINEWVNRMAFTVENIRVEKFEKPLGDFSPDDFRPDIVESRYSNRSVDDAKDALSGLADIWYGVGGEENRNGLQLVVNSLQTVDIFSEALEVARQDLSVLEGPLSSLPIQQAEDLEKGLESLKTLQRIIQTDLSQATQVTIRFNDTDGD